MSKFSTIQQALDKGTGTVKLRGWVHRERGSNKLKFVVLRDSTNIIQCVLKKETFDDKQWNDIDKLLVESSLTLEGSVHEDKRAPTGYELRVTKCTIIQRAEDFPLAKDQSIEFLADNRHLWIRSRKMVAILKVRSTVFQAIRDYYNNLGYYEYHSPMFQAVQCEGGSTLFNVEYFKQKGIFLSQTWQLYAEPAIFGLEKIYTIAPAFRAEKSKTSRHLTELWMAEMEAAWLTFDEMLDNGEGLMKHVVKEVLEKNALELEILQRDPKTLEPTVKKKFPRMTYDEAITILKDKCNMTVEWGKDLRTIEEDKLSKLYDTPIIITRYPKKVKAFYMKEDPDNPDVVLGADFIAPEGYGEIIGSSERESDLEEIERRLQEQGENPDEYQFYLDTRRYGSVPHSGFGMGVERIISWICGLDNIKDAIAFPRTMGRHKP